VTVAVPFLLSLEMLSILFSKFVYANCVALITLAFLLSVISRQVQIRLMKNILCCIITEFFILSNHFKYI
jgi:hypothetical protein